MPLDFCCYFLQFCLEPYDFAYVLFISGCADYSIFSLFNEMCVMDEFMFSVVSLLVQSWLLSC